ncbi:MAG: hypothetical protein EPO32_10365 [Anaerolineae bacterium]|nr:MAG: hypothetical protein EPO32_10365 [Anaerolineae bacterium]
MKPTTRLYLFIGVLTLVAMACAVGGGDSGGGDTGSGGGDANLLYEDDFSNTGSGWDRYSDSDGSTDYSNNQYQITINTSQWLMWANPGRSFTDAIIEVDATTVGLTAESDTEDDNNFGIICRHQDTDNFYVLVISSDGYYGIRKRFQGASELAFIGLDGMDTSDAINTGNATNHLKAECVGGTLRLIVNGTTLLEVTDTDIPSGDSGLMAGTFSSTSTTILFDNFSVRQP